MLDVLDVLDPILDVLDVLDPILDVRIRSFNVNGWIHWNHSLTIKRRMSSMSTIPTASVAGS